MNEVSSCWFCEATVESDARYCAACAQEGTRTPLRFDQYVVRRRLGRGGFGIVYQATDLAAGRDVAVKYFGDEGPDASGRLRKEVEAWANLLHPNIVTIYHVPSHDDSYFVMEYAAGGSLRDAIDQRPTWVRQHFDRIAEHLTEALRYAHRARTVHRDIKPDNILITTDDRVLLSDFGIATVLGDSDGRAYTWAGTFPYMAPEVFEGAGYGVAADLFSLGVVFYELWTGHLPYETSLPMEYLRRIHEREYENPRVHNPDTPRTVADIISRLIVPLDSRISSAQLVNMELRAPTESALSATRRTTLDELQIRLNFIYGRKNQTRSESHLLNEYGANLNGALLGMLHNDSDYRQLMIRRHVPRAVGWLLAFLTAANLRFSEAVWFKYPDKCIYCGANPCGCPFSSLATSAETSRMMLESVDWSRLDSAPDRSLGEHLDVFRQLYGQRNAGLTLAELAFKSLSEHTSAVEALIRVGSLKETKNLQILILEIADTIAWLFAIILRVQEALDDYDVEADVLEFYSRGCYRCSHMPCTCPTTLREVHLAQWRHEDEP